MGDGALISANMLRLSSSWVVCSTILLGRVSEKESVRIGVVWRTMFFGMFRLTFTPPLNLIHIYFFVQAKFSGRCSNAITTFAASSFDAPPPADLNMGKYITCLCNQRRCFPVSSDDDCIQSSPQSHSFTIVVVIVTIEPGFIVAQEGPKAAYVRFDAAKNIRMLRSCHRWLGISLDWRFSGLTRCEWI